MAQIKSKLIVGAWKAYLTNSDAVELAEVLAERHKPDECLKVAVCPSFISLVSVNRVLQNTTIALGAQNVSWEPKNGAFTSQITAQQLSEIGCSYVIVGHSEVRDIGETDELVNRRIHCALDNNLQPILCVGESFEERAHGKALSRIMEQLHAALKDIKSQHVSRILVAYEPVWAIRSSKNPSAHPATLEQATEMHEQIRNTLSAMFGSVASQQIRILYGGSVSSTNVESLIKDEHVDGLLVGAASVKAREFLKILDLARKKLHQLEPITRLQKLG